MLIYAASVHNMFLLVTIILFLVFFKYLNAYPLFEEQSNLPEDGLIVPYQSVESRCPRMEELLKHENNIDIGALLTGPNGIDKFTRKIVDTAIEQQNWQKMTEPYDSVWMLGGDTLSQFLPGMRPPVDKSDAGYKKALAQSPGSYVMEWFEDTANLYSDVLQLYSFYESNSHLTNRIAARKLLTIGRDLREIICKLFSAMAYHRQMIDEDSWNDIINRKLQLKFDKEGMKIRGVVIIYNAVLYRISNRQEMLTRNHSELHRRLLIRS